jgi:hypothetical protein
MDNASLFFFPTRYTYDFGTSWKKDLFHPHAMEVDGVLNEADINTLSVRSANQAHDFFFFFFHLVG